MDPGSARRLMALLCALMSFALAAVAQPSNVAIVHVTIIDPTAGKPQPDMTIVVRDRSIVRSALRRMSPRLLPPK